MAKPELFIGGPVDGQRMAMLHGNRASFPSTPSVSERTLRPVSGDNVDRSAPRSIYRRELITANGVEMFVWILEEIETHQAIALLIEKYPEPAS